MWHARGTWELVCLPPMRLDEGLHGRVPGENPIDGDNEKGAGFEPGAFDQVPKKFWPKIESTFPASG